ncbi:tyrosine-type recombinase/integrase [Rummeliibacillus sp. POC4]|uniref:tyrosine-type recombinase/integrase n=1 Tax=Rummeliibacillus sp. POC4 TaxID=2305899 RepID=UPI000E66AA7A|nr:tyrosine-type recombinase/integrase [Rummeliibacillus sp. POC4]RIJ69375.1 integrase [Rummeliibacillus sp. POC4]
MTDEQVVMNFKQWLIEDGKADATVKSYVNDVRKFNEYLNEREVAKEEMINRFYFTSYIKHLKAQEVAVNTINKKITSLKVYNDWLFRTLLVKDVYISIKRDKVKVANGSEDEVSVLNEEEVERFLFHMEKESQRKRVMGYMLLYTGLRVSELVNVRLEDIDNLTSTLRVNGKGGKIREVPLRSDVKEVIQQYIKGERAEGVFSNSRYLLISQRAEQLHRDTVRKWLDEVGKHLQFHIHPHMLRHTFCTRLLKNGVEMATVAKLAGHSSVNTTMKHYINISSVEKKNAVDLL